MSESPPNSSSTSSSFHRKIELQSPEDLSYLLTNVQSAAVARLNEAFPPLEDAAEDGLRAGIEELVNQYIAQTFTLAAPNLSINGLPIDNVSAYVDSVQGNGGKDKLGAGQRAAAEEEENVVYEPFDGRKREKVEELTREEEDLLREIAALKRTVPATAAAVYAENFKLSVQNDEEALALRKYNLLGGRTGEGGNEDGGTAPGHDGTLGKIALLERQASVEENFEKAVQGLSRLKKEMSATAAKMERARSAGEYVVTGR